MIFNNSATIKSKLYLIASMMIFGSIGIFRRYIPLPSGMLAMLRGFIGALFILVIMLVKKQSPDIKAIKSNLIYLLISGGMIGFNWILLFEAYNFTSVSNATLCYYMAPIFVIIASPIVLKERLTTKSILSAIIAVLGMTLISGVYNVSFKAENQIKGIILALGAAALYACVIICNKKIKSIDSYNKTLIQLASAGVVLIPYSLFAEDYIKYEFKPFIILLVFLVSVIHTGLAYSLYFSSLKALKAKTIAIFSYIDPIIALILSSLILKESMSLSEIFGAILILGAAFFSELQSKKKTP